MLRVSIRVEIAYHMPSARTLKALLLVLAAGPALVPVPAVAQTRWELSSVLPEQSPQTRNAVRFAHGVKEATKGAVSITIKSDGQSGLKGVDQWRAVRDGQVALAGILGNQLVAEEPVLGVESIPFLVASAGELKVLHKHIRPLYDQVAARNNQRLLYAAPWPTQHLFLRVRADTLGALAGVKVRAADKGAADMLSALGLKGVRIAWQETLPALAAGTVEGIATSSTSAVDGRLWELAKYIVPTSHVWSSQLVTVNLDAWRRLTAEQQGLIEAVARKLEPELWAAAQKADADNLTLLVSKGMVMAPVNPAMAAEMRAKTSATLEEYMRRVPAAQPALKAYLAEMQR